MRDELIGIVAGFAALRLKALKREDWDELSRLDEALAESLEALGAYEVLRRVLP